MLALIALATPWISVLTRWRTLVSGLLLIILFIPMSRYTLGGALPFKPSRTGSTWRRSRSAGCSRFSSTRGSVSGGALRHTAPDHPRYQCALGDRESGRVKELFSVVLKGQTFFISFFVVFFLIISLVRTRLDVQFFVRVLAWGGAVVAFFGIIERRTGYNIFNHLKSFFPLLQYEGGGEQFRSGRLRVLASSQHPIALSVLLVILLPLVLYLARCAGRKWLLIAGLYIVAIFTTASRTGIIGLVILMIVYLALQPRTVLRAWPAVIPLLAVVHIAAPGAIGTDPRALQPEHARFLADVGDGRQRCVRQRSPDRPQAHAGRMVEPSAARDRVRDPHRRRPGHERPPARRSVAGHAPRDRLGRVPRLDLAVRPLSRHSRDRPCPRATHPTAGSSPASPFDRGVRVTMGFYDALSFVQNVFILFIIVGLAGALLNARADEERALTATA